MAIQTKIDGGKQAITFYKDTEPCAVYVDGELQQDVSFVPSELVQGTGSVEYTSEYKKNQINMEIQGTTEQYQYEGIIATTESLTPYSSYEEGIAATHPYYSRILRSTQPVIFPTTDDASINVGLINVESIASQIPLYETLFLIDENMDAIYNLFSFGNALSQTVPTNISYYLGIADEEDVGNDNERCYNLFVQNGSLQFEYNVTTPSPQMPSPIENANGSPKNLFDSTKVKEGYRISTTGVETATTGYFVSDYIEVKPNTKYSAYIFDGKETSSGYIVWRVCWYDENKNFISMPVNYSQPRLRGYAFSATSPSNAKYVRFDAQTTIKFVMFNEGDYAPYKAYDCALSINVHSNNLLKLVDGEFVVENTLTVTIKNGIITLNGYIEGTSGVSVIGFGFEPVFLEANKTYIIRLQKYSSNSAYWISGADTNIGYVGGGGKAYTPTSNNVLSTIYFYVDKGKQYDNFSFAPAFYLQGTETPYEKPFSETVDIPTKVTYTNAVGTSKTVTLLMSKHDKLIVNRASNKVIYAEGSFHRIFTGQEAIAYSSGYKYFIYSIGYLGHYPAWSTTSNAFCNYLKVGTYYDMNDLNGFCVVQNENYIGLWTDRNTSLEDFKAWLTQLYNEGRPLIVVVKRQTPVEHDITNTDLGQSLINLATENNINYIEVQGNGKAPAIPIKTTYAKWGGNIDNNNNT